MKPIAVICAVIFMAGCASGKYAIKATSSNSEVVTAEGSAPIINNDMEGAKRTALSDALKNALALVVGVYVSQEALVSKAILIEDNITSQSEGYVEKYVVLKELRDGEFYKTSVKALVRKEDLAAKLKAMDLEPKTIGNPTVRVNIEEIVDGVPSSACYAENELKQCFINKGFTVTDQQDTDILVTGRAESSFNTDS